MLAKKLKVKGLGLFLRSPKAMTLKSHEPMKNEKAR